MLDLNNIQTMTQREIVNYIKDTCTTSNNNVNKEKVLLIMCQILYNLGFSDIAQLCYDITIKK